LLETLFDEDWQVRRESAIALSRFPSPSTIAGLSGALDDTHWQVIKEALARLGKSHAQVTPGMIPLLLHGIADVRIAAITALGESTDKTVLPALKALSNDPDTG